MFALPSHLATPEPDPPGLEKRRPGSLGGQEGDGHTPRKDRYLSRPNLSLTLSLPSRSRSQVPRGPTVSALYLAADESVTVTETPTEELPAPNFKAEG